MGWVYVPTFRTQTQKAHYRQRRIFPDVNTLEHELESNEESTLPIRLPERKLSRPTDLC